MKTRIFVTALFAFLLVQNIKAQSKEEEAQLKYEMGQEEYENGNYQHAIQYLDEAENLTEMAKVKTSYMKTRCYQKLLFTNSTPDSLYSNCMSSIKYYLANGKDDDKKKELLKLKIKVADVLAAQEKVKQEKEEADKKAAAEEEKRFFKVKYSDDIDAYDNFFYAYPNSKHQAELRPKYNQLVAQKKIADQKAMVAHWKEYNLPLLKRYRSAGPALAVIGPVFLVGGCGSLIYGSLELTGTVDKRNYTQYNYTTSGSSYPLGVQSAQYGAKDKAIGISAIGAGAIGIITGLILTPIGARLLHKAIEIKNDAKEKNIELSLVPFSNPLPNTYCLAFNVTF